MQILLCHVTAQSIIHVMSKGLPSFSTDEFVMQNLGRIDHLGQLARSQTKATANFAASDDKQYGVFHLLNLDWECVPVPGVASQF